MHTVSGVGPALRNIDRINAALASAGIVLHHPKKNEKFGMAGSYVIKAHADVVLEIEKMQDLTTGKECFRIGKLSEHGKLRDHGAFGEQWFRTGAEVVGEYEDDTATVWGVTVTYMDKPPARYAPAVLDSSSKPDKGPSNADRLVQRVASQGGKVNRKELIAWLASGVYPGEASGPKSAGERLRETLRDHPDRLKAISTEEVALAG
jgi:hypothetical protein